MARIYGAGMTNEPGPGTASPRPGTPTDATGTAGPSSERGDTVQRQQKDRPGGNVLATCLVMLVAIAVTALLAFAIVQLSG